MIGEDGGELAVLGDAVDVGGGLLGLFLLAFPLAVDAEQRIGEPDRVVGLDHDVVRRVQPLALELVGQHRDLAVLLGAGDAAGDRMLAGDEPALTVARVAVGVVGVGAEHAGLAGFLVELHDAVVGDVGKQQIAAFGEIRRPFGPAHAGRNLLDRRGIDPVFGEARIEDLHRRIGIALVRRERKRLRAGGAGEKCRSSSGAAPASRLRRVMVIGGPPL